MVTPNNRCDASVEITVKEYCERNYAEKQCTKKARFVVLWETVPKLKKINSAYKVCLQHLKAAISGGGLFVYPNDEKAISPIFTYQIRPHGYYEIPAEFPPGWNKQSIFENIPGLKSICMDARRYAEDANIPTLNSTPYFKEEAYFTISELENARSWLLEVAPLMAGRLTPVYKTLNWKWREDDSPPGKEEITLTFYSLINTAINDIIKYTKAKIDSVNKNNLDYHTNTGGLFIEVITYAEDYNLLSVSIGFEDSAECWDVNDEEHKKDVTRDLKDKLKV